MTTSLLNRTADGEMVLELWNKDRKVTVYVHAGGKTECLKVPHSPDDVVANRDDIMETDDLHEALEWLNA